MAIADIPAKVSDRLFLASIDALLFSLNLKYLPFIRQTSSASCRFRTRGIQPMGTPSRSPSSKFNVHTVHLERPTFWIYAVNWGAGTMAQWVKCFCASMRTWVRKPDTHMKNPRHGETETGRSLRFWPVSLTKLVSSDSLKDPFLENVITWSQRMGEELWNAVFWIWHYWYTSNHNSNSCLHKTCKRSSQSTL